MSGRFLCLAVTGFLVLLGDMPAVAQQEPPAMQDGSRADREGAGGGAARGDRVGAGGVDGAGVFRGAARLIVLVLGVVPGLGAGEARQRRFDGHPVRRRSMSRPRTRRADGPGRCR